MQFLCPRGGVSTTGESQSKACPCLASRILWCAGDTRDERTGHGRPRGHAKESGAILARIRIKGVSADQQLDQVFIVGNIVC